MWMTIFFKKKTHCLSSTIYVVQSDHEKNGLNNLYQWSCILFLLLLSLCPVDWNSCIYACTDMLWNANYRLMYSETKSWYSELENICAKTVALYRIKPSAHLGPFCLLTGSGSPRSQKNNFFREVFFIFFAIFNKGPFLHRYWVVVLNVTSFSFAFAINCWSRKIRNISSLWDKRFFLMHGWLVKKRIVFRNMKSSSQRLIWQNRTAALWFKKKILWITIIFWLSLLEGKKKKICLSRFCLLTAIFCYPIWYDFCISESVTKLKDR